MINRSTPPTRTPRPDVNGAGALERRARRGARASRSSRARYRGKRVLITGGLGFLGSTLAHRLVRLRRATSRSSTRSIRCYGGNRFNVHGLSRPRSTTARSRDVRDLAADARRTSSRADFIFHLAAQVSYIDSLNMPLEDLHVNAGLTLQLLEECRQHQREADDSSSPAAAWRSARSTSLRHRGVRRPTR